MEQKKNPLKPVKFEVRHSPLLLKILLTLLIVFSIGALTALRWVHMEFQTQIDDLRAEAAVLEYDNEKLEEKIGSLGSVQSIQEIAKEELGLVDPNTVVIKPE